ncbi:nucleotidyl transferase AbiEii/AbiGii toxin family protein [Candidatus Woesearchaeota archaeon]|nr:nucleotidyl transferase AbiEii/AbiGii toxin family protein [Candidatus Woesearchaeota archaeon]
MKLPLATKIKKTAHQAIAYAQDLMMEEVYAFFPKAVFHGGTAIWRCYGGNRFSEDLDFYLPDKKVVSAFFERLQQKGFVIHKQRVKDNSLYSLLEFNRAQVRFEALFLQKKSAVLKEYELLDGNFLTVYTLSAEELLEEKISACLKRAKVRDLYDIFFLLRQVEKKPTRLEAVEKVQIVDAETLPLLILSGPVPTVKEMKEYILRWEK